MRKNFISVFWLLTIVSTLLVACGTTAGSGGAGATGPSNDPNALNIVAGSEQEKVLTDIVMPWCKSQDIICTYTLKGSVDQANLLKTGNTTYDVF